MSCDSKYETITINSGDFPPSRNDTIRPKKKHSYDSQRITHDLEVQKCAERFSELQMGKHEDNKNTSPPSSASKPMFPKIDLNQIGSTANANLNHFIFGSSVKSTPTSTSGSKSTNTPTSSGHRKCIRAHQTPEELENTEIISFFSEDNTERTDTTAIMNEHAGSKRPSVSFDSHDSYDNCDAYSLLVNGSAKKTRRVDGANSSLSCCSTQSAGSLSPQPSDAHANRSTPLIHFINMSPLSTHMSFTALPPLTISPRFKWSKTDSPFSPVQHIRSPVNDTSRQRKLSFDAQRGVTTTADTAAVGTSATSSMHKENVMIGEVTNAVPFSLPPISNTSTATSANRAASWSEDSIDVASNIM